MATTKKKEEKAVATTEEKAVATTEEKLPTTLQHAPARGLEEFSSDLVIIPRIKLVQALSDEVNKGTASPGDLVNTLEGIKLGKSIKFVPVKMTQSRILFRDIKDGRGVLCRAEDARHGNGEPGGNCKDCPLSQWGEENGETVPPPCTQYINFIGMIIDEKNKEEFKPPIAISFGRTSFNTGKQLANILKMRRQDIWKFIFEIKSEFTQNGEFKFYVFKFSLAGKSSEMEQQAGEIMFDYIQDLNAQIEFSDDEAFETERIEDEEIQKEKDPKGDIPF